MGILEKLIEYFEYEDAAKILIEEFKDAKDGNSPWYYRDDSVRTSSEGDKRRIISALKRKMPILYTGKKYRRQKDGDPDSSVIELYNNFDEENIKKSVLVTGNVPNHLKPALGLYNNKGEDVWEFTNNDNNTYTLKKGVNGKWKIIAKINVETVIIQSTNITDSPVTEGEVNNTTYSEPGLSSRELDEIIIKRLSKNWKDLEDLRGLQDDNIKQVKTETNILKEGL